MKYKDRIYGETDISEPVILDLINSPSIQRLKGIDQAGYFEPFFPGTAHSRFEHSVGVYLLLKTYGASLREQIAGLIHDVSHSAFSHCIDYVLDAGSEKEHNHQDNIFKRYVNSTEIPKILNRYNIGLDYITDDKNFPLKERELPDLCADRIDYSLRTAVVFKVITDAKYFLDNLSALNNFWVFKNYESALAFAVLFKKLNDNYYSGIFSAVMFRAVGDYLRLALKKNYITETDLYTTDKNLLAKIEPYLRQDDELKILFDRMNNKVKFDINQHDYTAKVFCKSRVVNPLFLDGGEIRRLSEAEKEWQSVLEEEKNPKEYYIKFDK